jgi:hypothetical protein
VAARRAPPDGDSPLIRIAVLGAGHIGDALVALLGARPEFEVVLWGRRLRRCGELEVTAFGEAGIYAVGSAIAEPSLARAVDGAEVVVCTVPAHVRWHLLRRIARRLDACLLLVAWEGMGRFAESVRALGFDPRLAVGFQRSPMLCRRRERHRSVEILGVRSRVVAAPVDSGNLGAVEKAIGAVLPFHFSFASEYAYAALSPGNPLIHPARLYSCALRRRIAVGMRFYADWDDDASEVLLRLHAELATLRDALGLAASCLSTLVDGARPSPRRVTRAILAARPLRAISLPIRLTARGPELDRRHRFFDEDIGEGLAHIHRVARRCGLHLPTTEAICRWYAGGAPPGAG